jgi:ATP-dependent 26S proteasome regulatory subunit
MPDKDGPSDDEFRRWMEEMEDDFANNYAPPTTNNNNVTPINKDSYVPPHDDFSFPLLKDIHGTPEFKNTLEDILLGMKSPEVFERFGVKPEKSFLLKGPPGVGKTMGVKAIRNEIEATGITVHYAPYDIGTHGTAYINMGAVNLQAFFDEGKKMGNQKDSIVMYFFDEAESVIGKRQDGGGVGAKEDDKLTNTYMTNVNNIIAYGTNEYVFLATNFPEAMDEAALRAGRIDRVVNFELPGTAEIAHGYKVAAERINEKIGYKFVRSNYINDIARKSNGFNYADVEQVVARAVRDYISYALRNPNDLGEKPILTKEFFERAYESRVAKKDTVKTKPIGFGSWETDK